MAKQIGQAYHQPKLTKEQQEQKIMLFLQQKRETFTLSILNGLFSNASETDGDVSLVNRAVQLADTLLATLYPGIKQGDNNNQ